MQTAQRTDPSAQAQNPATDVSRHAVIYCRVSDEKQRDNYSLDTQEEGCLSMCAAEGLTVAAVLREVNSGADWDRPIFQDALDYLRRGEAGVFVVYALDRFMRDQDGNIAALFEIEKQLGCRATSVKERLGDSDNDKLLRYLYGWLADHERKNIVERTSRGRKARVERDGLPLPGPTAPYGYRWVYETRADGRPRKTRLEEDPQTAPIVRRIFQEMANGATLGAVARGLDADGIPTPSQVRPSTSKKSIAEQWARSSIQKMVANPYYAGAAQAYRWQAVKRKERNPQTGRAVTKRSQRKRPEPGVALPAKNVPALVPAEEWQAVQAQLARNKDEAGRNRRWPADQLLRASMAICAYCGRPMYVKHLSPNPQRRAIGAYVCAARYDWPSNRCEGGGPSVAVDILDADIWEKVLVTLSTGAFMLVLARRAAGEQGKANPSAERLARDIATREAVITDQEKRLKNLLRMQSDADDDEAYAWAKHEADETGKRLARMRGERDTLIAQRESLAENDRIAERLMAGITAIPGGIQLRGLQLPRLPGDPKPGEPGFQEMLKTRAIGHVQASWQAAVRDVAAGWTLDDRRAILRWLGVLVRVYRGNDPQPPDGKHWQLGFTLDGLMAALADDSVDSAPAIPSDHYRSR